MASGIRLRHGRLCPSQSGIACRCRPTYQANVWSAREGKRLVKTFASLAAAKAWRSEAQVALVLLKGNGHNTSLGPFWPMARRAAANPLVKRNPGKRQEADPKRQEALDSALRNGNLELCADRTCEFHPDRLSLLAGHDPRNVPHGISFDDRGLAGSIAGE